MNNLITPLEQTPWKHILAAPRNSCEYTFITIYMACFFEINAIDYFLIFNIPVYNIYRRNCITWQVIESPTIRNPQWLHSIAANTYQVLYVGSLFDIDMA